MEQIPSFAQKLTQDFYISSNKDFTWPLEYNLSIGMNTNETISLDSHSDESELQDSLFLNGSTLYPTPDNDSSTCINSEIDDDTQKVLEKIVKNVSLLSSHSNESLDWTCILKSAMALHHEIPDSIYLNACKRLIQLYGPGDSLLLNHQNAPKDEIINQQEFHPSRRSFTFDNIKDFI